MMYGNPPSRDFLNRRRWAVDQQKKALAAVPARDYEAERLKKLGELQALAAAMEELPHMARTLDAVRAEINRLSAR